jgi:hypothetical protein
MSSTLGNAGREVSGTKLRGSSSAPDLDPGKAQRDAKMRAAYRKLLPVLGLTEACSEKELMTAYNHHLRGHGKGTKELNFRLSYDLRDREFRK